MQALGPHYLLMTDSVGRTCQSREWRFVLQPTSTGERIVAADVEPDADGMRLTCSPWSAASKPRRTIAVTLLVANRFVRRGIRRDLAQWREQVCAGSGSDSSCRSAISTSGNGSIGRWQFTRSSASPGTRRNPNLAWAARATSPLGELKSIPTTTKRHFNHACCGGVQSNVSPTAAACSGGRADYTLGPGRARHAGRLGRTALSRSA